MAVDLILNEPTLREHIERINPRATTIEHTKNFLLRRPPRLHAAPALDRILVRSGRPRPRSIVVEHLISDGLRISLQPVAPIAHERRQGLEPRAFIRSIKRQPV